MKSTLLLSHRAKLIGVLVFIPAFILGIAVLFFEFEFDFLKFEFKSWMPFIYESGFLSGTGNNLTDEIALTFTVIGLLLIAFSKEKKEDEFIQKIRLESLQWAVLVSYLLLLVSTWFIYGGDYFIVMVISLLAVLFIFNIRFHWIMMRSSKKSELS